jgi:hypothetical protein
MLELIVWVPTIVFCLWIISGCLTLAAAVLTSPQQKDELRRQKANMTEEELAKDFVDGIKFALAFGAACLMGPLWLLSPVVRKKLRENIPNVRWHLGLGQPTEKTLVKTSKKVLEIKDLPQWAQDVVVKTSLSGTTQISGRSGFLSVSPTGIYFNGERILREGEIVEDAAGEMKFEDLPDWAQKTVREATPGSMINHVRDNNNSLQINGGTILFNGKRVIK